MYRSFLLVALLLLLALNRVQAQTNPEAKRLYDDGIARLEIGQFSEAVERFQKALKGEHAGETFRRAIALKAKERDRQTPMPQEALHPTPALRKLSVMEIKYCVRDLI